MFRIDLRSRLGTLFGLILLTAAACGVCYLFQGGNSDVSEEPEEEVAVEVNVHAGLVSRSVMHGYVLAYGRMEPAPSTGNDPPADVLITAPADKIVTDVMCAEGQDVNQGDVLFNLDSRLAEVAVQEARQAVELARQNLARQKQLMQSRGTSEKLLQQATYELAHAEAGLAQAEIEHSLLQVTAPISGTIVRTPVRLGETVAATSVLAELVDHKRLVAEFGIPSGEVAMLRQGQKVTIETGDAAKVSNDGTSKFEGEVTFIDSLVSPDSDTVLAQASVPADSALRPGSSLECA